MRRRSFVGLGAQAVGFLLVPALACCLDSTFPLEHPSLVQFGVNNGAKIEISEWHHWTSKSRPKAEIEGELRDEIRTYVFVNPGDRTKLERSNSLLGYSGSGKFVLPNGVELLWKQTSTLLKVQVPGKDGKSVWKDFAPRPWVLRLEKSRGKTYFDEQ